jgi:hypothetical protein
MNSETPNTRRAADRLLGPAGPELSCDECFAELDRYVEIELGGGDADSTVPGMRAHLEGCPACREDHESLKAFIAAAGAD